MNDEELETIYHLSLIILDLMAFLLNLLVVIIFIRYRKRFFPNKLIPRLRATRNHNKCLLSMAFADLLVGIFGTLTGILLKSEQTSLIYKLSGLIPLYGCMFASVFSLVLLTIDRLVAVKYPFSYDSFMANFRITTAIALCWMVPFLTTISQMIIYVTSGANLELKIRNTILTFVSLSGFTILAVANFILVQKVKEQRQLANELSGVSVKFGSARKGGSFSHAILTRIESEPNSAARSSVGIDSCASIPPEIEVRKVSSPGEAILAQNQNWCQSCQTIAFITRHESLDAPRVQQSKRNMFPVLCAGSCRAKDPNCSNNLSSIQEDKNKGESPCITESYDVTKKPKTSMSIPIQSSQATQRPIRKSKLIRKIPDSRITTMCIFIIVAFLVCWLPLVGYRFSYVVGRTTLIPWFRRLTQCLAMSNSLLNPFIYFLMRKEFRDLLQKLLKIEKKKSWFHRICYKIYPSDDECFPVLKICDFPHYKFVVVDTRMSDWNWTCSYTWRPWRHQWTESCVLAPPPPPPPLPHTHTQSSQATQKPVRKSRLIRKVPDSRITMCIFVMLHTTLLEEL